MSSLASAPLSHITDQELARLIQLWRSQAGSGQREASSIAKAFLDEQRRREMHQ